MSAFVVWMGAVMSFWRKSFHLLCAELVLKAGTDHIFTHTLPTHTPFLEEINPINACTQWISKYFTSIMQVYSSLRKLWTSKTSFLWYIKKANALIYASSLQAFEVPLILPHIPIQFRAHFQPSLTGWSGLWSAETVFFSSCGLWKRWHYTEC